MEKLSYKLPVFEGPLDLLLFLISKHKLNICDIQISALLEQYMIHIEKMRQEDLEIASEFLEMAAHLVYIKTASLLPKHEEAEELKQELADRLIIYQKCKVAAKILSGQVSFDSYSRPQMIIEADRSYKKLHDPIEMLHAYTMSLSRGKTKLPPPRDAFSGIVSRPVVSVSSKIIAILRTLRRMSNIPYADVYHNAQSKSELVAIFLAILELIKGKRIRLEENETGDVQMNGGERFWNRKSLNRQ